MNLSFNWRYISANRLEEIIIWFRKNSIPHIIIGDYIDLYSEEDMILFKLKFSV